jgi:transposase
MGDFSDFERERIVRARLVGASLTKTATLLSVGRATVSKVISAYTNHGKTTSAKRNSGRKSTSTDRNRRSLYIEDCFEKSQNYCSTVDRTAELNIHLEDLVSTNTVVMSFTKPISTAGLHIATPLSAENNVQMGKPWC